MVRWASGRAQTFEVLIQKLHQGIRVEDGLGLLIEKGLVGASATLRDEEELVLITLGGVKINLCGQVGSCVDLVKSGERCHLRVAQVGLSVRVVDTLRDGFFVRTAQGPHVFALLAHHDRRSGILAARKHHTSSDVGILEELKGNETIVFGGLWIIQNVAQLLEMSRTQQMSNVTHRLAGQEFECFRIDFQNFTTIEVDGFNELVGHLPILCCDFRLVQWKHLLILKRLEWLFGCSAVGVPRLRTATITQNLMSSG
mmetsp:Transcript_4288/g.10520  ORF Transcript_4288/g.10520 Transcript_4288/m.10520 type:complete len:256 (+) Transcript_4288:974-1741(+)